MGGCILVMAIKELFVQGFVMNMQTSEAEAGFDLRMPPTADPDLVKIRIAEEWAPAIRNMTYQVTNDLYLYLNS